jgi:hypothetical protein
VIGIMQSEGGSVERTTDGEVRKAFWCAWSGRDVEAEFLTDGVPGFRSLVAVRRCTAFQPPEDVVCARRCLDPDFRRLWDASSTPVAQEEVRP